MIQERGEEKDNQTHYASLIKKKDDLKIPNGQLVLKGVYPQFFGRYHQLLLNMFLDLSTPSMTKAATNVVASQQPERRPTGISNKDEPTACTHSAPHSAVRHFLCKIQVYFQIKLEIKTPWVNYLYMQIMLTFLKNIIHTKHLVLFEQYYLCKKKIKFCLSGPLYSDLISFSQ